MRNDEKPPTLNAVVGRNLRRLREQDGMTQDQLARRLRQLGLAWTRPTVAAVELGRKTLDVEELVLLSLAFGARTNAILAGDGRVQVCEAAPTLGVVRAVLASDEEVMKRTVRDVGPPNPEDVVMNFIQKATVSLDRLAILAPDVPLSVLQEKAAEAARGDVEQAAARKLSCSPSDLAVAAFGRWGRSLTDERDARVSTAYLEEASPRATQARRGHITRQLLEELKPILRKAGSWQP